MILKHRTKIDVRGYTDEILKLLDEEGLKWCTRDPLLDHIPSNGLGFLFITNENRNGYGDFTCSYMGVNDEHYFRNETDKEDITNDVLAIVATPEAVIKRRVLKELNE